MEGSSVTDWLQTGTGALALLLSIISLLWQWSSSRPKRAEVLRLNAETPVAGIWELSVSVENADNGTQLMCHLHLKTKGGGLFLPDLLGYLSDNTSPYVLMMPSKDWASGFGLATGNNMSVAMRHDRQSGRAGATFGVAWPGSVVPAYAEVEIRITAGDLKRPIITERRKIGPAQG